MSYRFRFGRMAVVTGAAVFLAIMLFPACRTATERALPPDGGAAVGGVPAAAVQHVASAGAVGAAPSVRSPTGGRFRSTCRACL